MLKTSWLTGRTFDVNGKDVDLLESIYEADMVAAAADPDDTGTVHFAYCPDAPDGVQVRFEMPWKLAMQIAPERCWCADPANTNLPAEVRAVDVASELQDETPLAVWSVIVPLIGQLAPLVHAHTLPWGQNPGVATAEFTATIRDAVVRLGLFDEEFVTRPRDAYAQALRSSRFVADTDITPPAAGEPIDDWYEHVIDGSVWVDADRLSSISAVTVSRLWVPADLSTHTRALALAPRAALTNTIASGAVISENPHATAAELSELTEKRK